MSRADLRGVIVDGRYEPITRLGVSGPGQVWRAKDAHLDRDVALKILTGLADAGGTGAADLLARLEGEAGALAGLDSPHLATVHGHGTAEVAGQTGVGYLVLAPPRGRTLQQQLREQGIIDWRRALAWTEQLCTGLAAAHAAGVMHGGLTPASAMLNDSDSDNDKGGGGGHGAVTVWDVGLTNLPGGGIRSAGDTPAAGGVLYLAPERCDGTLGDARSDLYAAGCVLYELLVGHPPYTGSVDEVLRQHRESLPLRPSRAVPEIPEAVDDVVFTLMARDPADRPADATIAAAALEKLRTNPDPLPDTATALLPPPAAPADDRSEPQDTLPAEPADAAPAGAARTGRRRQYWVRAAAAALVAVVGLLGYLALTAYDQDQVRDAVKRAARQLNSGAMNGTGMTLEEAAEQALDDSSGWLRLRTSDMERSLASGPEGDAVTFEVTNLLGRHPVCFRVATHMPEAAYTARYSPGPC